MVGLCLSSDFTLWFPSYSLFDLRNFSTTFSQFYADKPVEDRTRQRFSKRWILELSREGDDLSWLGWMIRCFEKSFWAGCNERDEAVI